MIRQNGPIQHYRTARLSGKSAFFMNRPGSGVSGRHMRIYASVKFPRQIGQRPTQKLGGKSLPAQSRVGPEAGDQISVTEGLQSDTGGVFSVQDPKCAEAPGPPKKITLQIRVQIFLIQLQKRKISELTNGLYDFKHDWPPTKICCYFITFYSEKQPGANTFAGSP